MKAFARCHDAAHRHFLRNLTAAAVWLAVAGSLQASTLKPHRVAFRAEGSPAVSRHVDFGKYRPSRAAEQVAHWVLSSGDNHGSAFIIVDKVDARIYVFNRSGKMLGTAPVLLGLAKGDDSAPGIGDKKLADIKPQERTTPAGRFIAEPGINAHGQDIVWVDYDAAISMHRVLTSNPAERRAQRLASRTVKDNRISYGCINLPKAFYEKVVSPTVNAGETIVYVLPETRPASVVFGFRDGISRRTSPAALTQPGVIQLQRLDGA